MSLTRLFALFLRVCQVFDPSLLILGDYIVHIDHGVGIFGGLVKMRDDKDRVKEVVKLMYRDGDVVFVSVHSLHKISRFL